MFRCVYRPKQSRKGRQETGGLIVPHRSGKAGETCRGNEVDILLIGGFWARAETAWGNFFGSNPLTPRDP